MRPNLLSYATTLDLFGNLVTSIENGDFQGLSNLQTLVLGGNQITSLQVSSGARLFG